ncbi:unnamed protein product [Triticum turgidum subsp. durum]|uniref:EGF-like calcium-binding domain-containing protein n=1 Tax=Triticum turgidum subsp. durum TaxID=4567 RepID=A0A9R1PHY1_TRITD|nr:unnamed protein product [Triticum turgidum subsp. durum]
MAFNKLAPAVGFIVALTAFCLSDAGALVPPGNCTRECGGLEIPYPFGIDLEDGCQLSDRRQGFKLRCLDRGGRGKRLYYINQEVLEISLEHGQVRWLNNISSYCYNATAGEMKVNSPPSNMDLEGSIFRLSDTANKFTVLGCKTLAYIGDTNNSTSYTAVCGATCKDGNLSLLTNDVDECLDPKNCEGTCHNIIGDFICCPPRTKYDPKKMQCTTTKKKTLVIGVTIGLGAGFGMLLLGLSGMSISYRWKRCVKKQQRRLYFQKNQGLLLEQLILSDENASDRTMIFSLEELEKATNNFDETRIVGRGGHGMVYKGIL